MRVVLLNNSKDPTTQRVKLVVVLLFLLPALVALYYFTADYIASDQRQKTTKPEEIELRAKQATYDASDRLLEVVGILGQVDDNAKKYFGTTHQWSEGSPETHSAIMEWVSTSENTAYLREYHDLDSNRLTLLRTIEELTSLVDQAGTSANKTVVSELKVKRLSEQNIAKAMADAEALSAGLDSLGAEYLAFKENRP